MVVDGKCGAASTAAVPHGDNTSRTGCRLCWWWRWWEAGRASPSVGQREPGAGAVKRVRHQRLHRQLGRGGPQPRQRAHQPPQRRPPQQAACAAPGTFLAAPFRNLARDSTFKGKSQHRRARLEPGWLQPFYLRDAARRAGGEHAHAHACKVCCCSVRRWALEHRVNSSRRRAVAAPATRCYPSSAYLLQSRSRRMTRLLHGPLSSPT